MSALVQPLATVDIAGVGVRFFRAPLDQPHLPWHAVDDLHRVLRFPPDLSARMLRNARAFPGGDFVAVATADGIVNIGSHPMAQGLIGAALELDTGVTGVPRDVERLYARAAGEAFNVLAGDLPPMASYALMLQAARNTLGGGE